MKKLVVFCILICLISGRIYSQIGGDHVYEFLNLTNSARAGGLGGNLISVKDNDLSLVYGNPSLLNKQMNKHLMLSYVNYFADINYGFISYARDYGKLGTFAAGIHYINYGDFTGADPTGQITGEFSSSEYSFNILWGKDITKNLSIGANIKPVYSVFELYESFGFASDIGLTWFNEKTGFTAAFVVKNMGLQISTYYGEERGPIPFEIQAGISKKLSHAPFRLSVISTNLEKWDLSYTDSQSGSGNIDPATGLLKNENKFADFSDKLMRHVIFGIEFLPSNNFMIRLGYNYRRHKEMRLITRNTFSGFSFGLGFKLSVFTISYSNAIYHVAGTSNLFTISTNLSEIIIKK